MTRFLKKQFLGGGPVTAVVMPNEDPPPKAIMNHASQIRYMNTDLEMVCDVAPGVLVSELESHGLVVLVNPREDGLFRIMCEDATGDAINEEPELNIESIVEALEAMSAEARSVWQQCSLKEFDIGYECGDEPWGFTQAISHDLLQRIVSAGASFRITIYPHRSEDPQGHLIVKDDLGVA